MLVVEHAITSRLRTHMVTPPESSSLFSTLEQGNLSRAHVERFATELAIHHASSAGARASAGVALGYANHVGSILKHVFLHQGCMVLERPGPREQASLSAVSDVSAVMLEFEAFGSRQLAHCFLACWLLHSGAFDSLEELRRQIGPSEPVTPAPFLAITHGVSGAGKTTLVSALVGVTGALAVNNDAEAVRLRRAGVELHPGVLAAKLESLAEHCLRAGWPVIVESCFLGRDDRGRFRARARVHGVPFAVLACTAPAPLIGERLERRRAFGSLFHGSNTSADTVRRGLDAQLARMEALDASERAHAVAVDTSVPVDVARVTARLYDVLDSVAPTTRRFAPTSNRWRAKVPVSPR